ncbi:MAG: hypothetical protein PHN75_20545 [Syntrophales bacterium]|nr:hypothetical protein [Syntrophales bacterium]
MSKLRAFFLTAFSGRYRLKTLLFIFGLLFVLTLFGIPQNQNYKIIPAMAENASTKNENTPSRAPKYTAKQIKAAKDSWRIITQDLRDVGLVRDIKNTSTKTIIYVEGSAWRSLPYEKKKELYYGIIRTKNIIENVNRSWIDIRDYRSGKIYAEQGVFSSDVYGE